MIISGGQTGADVAGLEVALQNGIPTGGWAPVGWRTSIGPNPNLLRDRYGLKENDRKGYKSRTYANARDSDATVRLAVDFTTAGEKCTLNAIKSYNKPYYDINLLQPEPVSEFVSFLINYNVKILNVAGNTQGTLNYDIFSMVFEYLNRAIQYSRSLDVNYVVSK